MSGKQSTGKPTQGPSRPGNAVPSTVKTAKRPSTEGPPPSRPGAKPADTMAGAQNVSITVETTGALGTHVEFDGYLWKVAYSGPVYFSEVDHLGLIACSDQKGTEAPPGDCNGTVDGVAYFLCEDKRGRLVPRSVVLGAHSTLQSTPPTHSGVPSDRVEAREEDALERSLSGLVVGPQSLRRLRDESPAQFQHRTIATQSCDVEPRRVASVATETDPFVLSDLSIVPAHQCNEVGVPVEQLQRSVNTMFTPLREALTRLLQQVAPLMEEERRWVETTTRRATALDEAFSWDEIVDSHRPTSEVCIAIKKEAERGTNRGEDADPMMIPVVANSRLAPFVTHQIDTMQMARRERLTMPHDMGGAVEAILHSARCEAAAESMDALRAALTPVLDYANLPTSCIQLDDRQVGDGDRAHAAVTGDPQFVARVDEQRNVHEQLKRLAFALAAASNDATVAAGEGHIEALESIGHNKVDIAQAMQRLACRLLEDFPELHDTYVDKPRLVFRDLAKAVKSEVEGTVLQQSIVPRQDALKTSVAAAEQHIEGLKETFVRRAFASSNVIVGMARELGDLDQEEQGIVEAFSTLMKKWESNRLRRIDVTHSLQLAVQERVLAFQEHHEAVASSTLMLLADKARLQALDSSSAVVRQTLVSLDRQQEAEEVAYMDLQRFVFELQTRAHQCHQEAFREVCLATEELACRKEQAHKVICDRLDRCTAELEIAMDSLEESSRGIAREKNELERIAKELYRDVSAIRAVGISSSGVFDKRTAPFLITCGKTIENPMLEAKKLSEQRLLKVFAITTPDAQNEAQ